MTRQGPAIQRAVKVDPLTDRRIAQLAYFMDVPKKTVVREAVAEYAEARLSQSSSDDVAVERCDASTGGDVSPAHSARMFEDLPLRDRLAMSRGQLIRDFAARGGTGEKIIEPRRAEQPDRGE